ncbi:aminotransferase-like domain-containing protein [Rugosimonospora africana]|uniref:GntR family transcriptional regulator n=1 Tax=Rugosimonospora africana TaxID=556532 RepID=A0A8J3R1F7_9ACTN|nr:PLP-dependent aminotransferase family protein [Rugosimonospora africana]GIH19610.1 GntR family transcriptional regulator [Rugosimonospora africana]
MVDLKREELHGSVTDPVAAAMNFLNEIAGRYPDAITLAAGRPYEGFFHLEDVHRWLDRYARHVSRAGGDPRRAVMQYGRTNGIIHELITEMLARDEDIRVPAEAVAVTTGCQEAMVVTLRGLFRPGDVLLAASPCYVGITGAARLLDIPVVPVPESASGLEPATVGSVAAQVRASGRRPRALYLVPDFANPSGAQLPLADRHRLLAAAAQADLLILEDNPYGLFGLTDAALPTLKALDRERRVVYLGSFAKSGFPGARIGFLVADQRVVAADRPPALLAEELSTVKSMLTLNTSPVTQAVVGGLLLECGCSLRAANREKIEFYRTNLTGLLDALDRYLPAGLGVRWNVPAGGFFAVLTVPAHGPAADVDLLETSARDYGVLWTPMGFFYPDGGGSRALRVSCSALCPADLDEGVRRLAKLLGDVLP